MTEVLTEVLKMLGPRCVSVGIRGLDTEGQQMSGQQLTITQVAEHFAVDPRTVRRWISSGVLPARRVGPRVIRIDLDDLDDFGRKLA